MKRIAIAVVAVLFIGGAGWYLIARGSQKSAGGYRTEKVARGELLASVSSTGTVEPEDVIDVGSQVAGMIKEFGSGPDGKSIDYGTEVEAGTVLVQIDDALYKAKVDQSRAQVRSAESRVEQAKAKAQSAKAKVEQAKANTQRAHADLLAAQARNLQSGRDLDRARRLAPTTALSQSDLDAAQAAGDTNRAGVGIADAALAQAKASEVDAQAALVEATAAIGDAEAAVDLARAQLKQDEVNLGYCTITSPVKGTIIDRRVTIGQTVQSSFNTPSLFLIAKDLKRMEVWASVNEADIGQVSVGQTVKFTVDAFPGETFEGKVGRIRLNATNTQNVVTYTVEVVTDNSSGRLLPYMTANLRFEVARRSNVLLVSNAALRYRPSRAAAEAPPPTKESAGGRQEHGTVWVLEQGTPRPVEVRIGLSDGNMTEVLDGLSEGAVVVSGESRGGPAEDATNPFSPKVFNSKKQ